MGLISLLMKNPVEFAIVAGVLLYSVILHEVAHGWVASLFGDDTAKTYGRLTLNPLPHIDPMGALMLLIAGFGWAKPVPVNYHKFQNFRFGLLSVSLAGCIANILIAVAAMVVLQFPTVWMNQGLSETFSIIARINIILGAFNLIPIPPLDGSKVLMAFLPQDMQASLSRIEPYGFFILIALLFTGILNPVISFMQNAIYALISIPFALFR
jgi:Zn-dependent protease